MFSLYLQLASFFFFFFNDTATTEIYTLSLHDALPILTRFRRRKRHPLMLLSLTYSRGDRKSTRLNSSHHSISYAVFCLNKKKNNMLTRQVCRLCVIPPLRGCEAVVQ